MKYLKQWIALTLTAVMLGTSIPSQALTVRAADTGNGIEEDAGETGQQAEDQGSEGQGNENNERASQGSENPEGLTSDGAGTGSDALTGTDGDSSQTGGEEEEGKEPQIPEAGTETGTETDGGESQDPPVQGGDGTGDTEESSFSVYLYYYDSNGNELLHDVLQLTGRNHLTKSDVDFMSDYPGRVLDSIEVSWPPYSEDDPDAAFEYQDFNSFEELYEYEVTEDIDVYVELINTYSVDIQVNNLFLNTTTNYHEEVKNGDFIDFDIIEELASDEYSAVLTSISSDDSGFHANGRTFENIKNMSVRWNLTICLELDKIGYHKVYIDSVVDDAIGSIPKIRFKGKQTELELEDGGYIDQQDIPEMGEEYYLNRIDVRTSAGESQTFYDLPELSGYQINSTCNITIHYGLNINDIDLKLDANGGRFTNNAEIMDFPNTYVYDISNYTNVNGNISYIWPERQGYILIGWGPFEKESWTREDFSSTAFEIEPSSTITLYAMWVESETQLILDPNGGTFENGSSEPFSFDMLVDTSMNSIYSSWQTEPYLSPVSEEGGFVEWNTEEEGTGETYYSWDITERTFGETTTLYAIYDDSQTVVSFDANGGLFNLTADNSDIFSGGGSDPILTAKGAAPADRLNPKAEGNNYNFDEWTSVVRFTDQTNTFEGYLNALPQALIREGYVFEGWAYYDEETGTWAEMPMDQEISEDYIFYAQWSEENMSTVTLHAVGHHFGISPDQDTLSFQVKNGTPFTSVPYTITQTDDQKYNYDGIYLDETCERMVPRGYVINGDTDFYVNYLSSADTRYTVTFYDKEPWESGAAVLYSIKVNDGSSIGNRIPAVPQKEGYRFLYWTWTNSSEYQYTDVSSFKVTSDTDFYAVWEEAPFSLTLDANGGIFPDGSTVKHLQLTQDEINSIYNDVRNIPSKDGCVFFDFSLNPDSMEDVWDGDLQRENTWYANWIDDTFQVTLHAGEGYFAPDGGKEYSFPVSIEYLYGDLDEIHGYPMYENGHIAYWTIGENDESGETFDTVFDAINQYADDAAEQGQVPSQLDLYAHYTSDRTQVTFDANGGYLNFYQVGESAVTGSEPEQPQASMITYNKDAFINLRRRFNVSSLARFTLDLSDGQNDQIFLLSDYIDFLSTTPQREGYSFTGWYTDSACTRKADETQYVETSMTLYAGWSDNCAKITVKAIGGCFEFDQNLKEVSFNATIGEVLPRIPYVTLQKNDILETGLFFDAEGTDPVMSNYRVQEDITLYLIFSNYYSVILNAMEGYFDLDNLDPGYEMETESVIRNGSAGAGESGDKLRIYVYNSSYYRVYLEEMPEPVSDMPGLLFQGWYWDEERTKPVTDDRYYYEDIHGKTLYAKYSEPITITLHLGEGHYYEDVNVHDYEIQIAPGTSLGSSDSFQGNPYADYMDFDGWYYDAEFTEFCSQNLYGIEFEEPTELYAKMTPWPTVTFDANGKGYFGSDQNVATYDLTISGKNYIQYSLSNVQNQLHAFDTDNYKLEGWYTDPECTTKVSSFYIYPEDGTVYYAKWKEKKTVTFHAREFASFNGEEAISISVWEGDYLYNGVQTPSDTISVNDPDQKVFWGWSTDPNARYGQARTASDLYYTRIQDNTDYYAIFKTYYTITFNLGSYGTTENQTVFNVLEGEYVTSQAASITVTDNDPHSKQFAGWSETENGSIITNFGYNAYRVAGDKTYYAVYKNVYEVIFKSGSHGYFGLDENGDEITELTGYFAQGSIIQSLAQQAFTSLITKDEDGRWEYSGKWGSYAENASIFTSTGITSNRTFTASYTEYIKVTFKSGDAATFGTDEEGNTVTEKVYRPAAPASLSQPASNAQAQLQYDHDRYIFAGWSQYGSADFLERFNSTFSYDVTFTAVFYPKREIRFTAGNDGYGYFEGLDRDYVTYIREGNSYKYVATNATSLIRNTDETQHVFAGWAAEGSEEIIEDFTGYKAGETDVVYHAVYKNVLEIILDANGGAIGEGQDNSRTVYITEGDPLSSVLPDDSEMHPESELYVFAGWSTTTSAEDILADPEQTVPAGSTVYYAIWKVVHNITFEAGEFGYFNDDPEVKTVSAMVPDGDAIASIVSQASTIKAVDHKMFVGWYVSTDESRSPVSFNGSETSVETITYVARYVTLYDITFSSGEGSFADGEKSAVLQVAEGVKLAEAAGQAGDALVQTYTDGDGQKWIFDCWTNAEGIAIDPENETVTGEAAYTARYKKVFTVTFEAGENGHFDSDSSLVTTTYEVAEDATLWDAYRDALSKVKPNDAEEYIFKSWTDAENNTVSATYFRSAMPESDMTFTAQWAFLYSITLHANGKGTIKYRNNTYDEVTVKVEEGKSLSSALYSYKGAADDPQAYAFAGWNENPDATEVQNLGNAEGNKNLYAVWKPVYPVTLVATYTGNDRAYIGDDEDQHTYTEYVMEGSLLSYTARQFEVNPCSDRLEFNGWYLDEERTETGSPADAVTGPVTYYAGYTFQFYITFNAGQDGIFQSKNSNVFTVRIGDGTPVRSYAANALNDLVINEDSACDITFDCWCRDAELTQRVTDWSTQIAGTNVINKEDDNTDGDWTYYAKYKKIYHIPVYAGNDGDFEGSQKTITVDVPEGESLKSALEGARRRLIENKSNKIFMGWALNQEDEAHLVTDLDSVTAGDEVEGIYALYEECWIITAELNDAEYGSLAVFSDGTRGTRTYKARKSTGFIETALDRPTLEGKGFGGWLANDEDTSPIDIATYKFTKNDSIYAFWVDLYTVTYETGEHGAFRDGTREISYEGIVSGSRIQNNYPLNPAPDANYRFLGWGLNGANGEDIISNVRSYVVIGDTVFHARWQKYYTITYDAGEGSFPDGTDTITYQVDEGKSLAKYVAADPVPSLEEWEFAGWIGPDGTVVENIRAITAAEDMTFTARWKEKYPVVFHAEGGLFEDGSGSTEERTVYVAENSTYDLSDVEAALTNPASGTAFNGWYYRDGDGQSVSIETLEGYSNGKITVSGPAHFYASWTEGYTVTVHTGEGRFGITNITCINIPVGSAIGDSPRAEIFDQITFEDSDKYLKGWSGSAGGEVVYADSSEVCSIIPAEDMDLYAVAGRFCTVTVMNENNTQVFSVSKVKEGEELGWVAVPASHDPHLYLAGLGTAADGSFDSRYWNIRITEDTTFYPHWEEKVTVTLDGNGGLINGKAQEVFYVIPGSKLGSVSFTRSYETKVFKGFCENADGSGSLVSLSNLTPWQDVTYYAKWADTFKITYHANGGYFADGSDTAVVYAEQMSRYSYVKEPAVYNTGDVAFIGWQKDGLKTSTLKYDKVTEDWDITAVWSEKYYTVTLNTGNGYLADGRNVTRKVAEGESLAINGNLPTCYASNYIFDGWYTEAEGGTMVLSNEQGFTSYKPESSVTLYAHYLPYYTVVLEANGGTFGDSDTLAFNQIRKNTLLYNLNLVTPVKEGYAFAGWYDVKNPGEEVNVRNVKVNSDMVLQASWTQDYYTVTFNPGTAGFNESFRGLPETGSRRIRKGSAVGDLAPLLAVEDGYYLDGWYSDADLTRRISDIRNYIPDQDVTVYARISKYIHVTFDANGGFFDNDSNNTVLVAEAKAGAFILKMREADLSRYDHDGVLAPAGWFDENGNKVTDSTLAREDVTYHIEWVVRPATIIEQPIDQEGPVGEIAEFSVIALAAEDAVITYQWFYCNAGTTRWVKSNLTGKDTDTVKVPITTVRDGIKFRCVITDERGNKITTDAGTLHVHARIITQPVSYVGDIGEVVVFAVRSAGAEDTYQWQTAAAGSDEWTDIQDETENELHFVFKDEDDGRQYRCVVHGYGDSTAVSNIVTATTDFTVIEHPEDVTGKIGSSVQFRVKANKEGAAYVWQYQDKGSTRWVRSRLAGCDTDTVTVPVTAARDGIKFRCVITYGNVNTTTSNYGTLTVLPDITLAPDNYTDDAETAVFRVKATGVDVTYQWQESTDNDTWTDTEEEGNKTNTLSVPNTEENLFKYYRCVVTDAKGKTAESESAYIVSLPVITRQPEEARGHANDAVELTAGAEGIDLKYQWQKQIGGEWEDIADACDSSVSITISDDTIGLYRCKISGLNNATVYTDAAAVAYTLMVSGPEDFYGAAGENATFTVSADGAVSKYQWQYKSETATSWSKAANGTTDTLVFGIADGKDKNQYRCIITDTEKNTVTTKYATLYVKPAITGQASDVSTVKGRTAAFTITATGKDRVYQWKYYDETAGEWTDITDMTGYNTRTLKVPATEERNGMKFKCLVTAGNGLECESDPVTLTVN